MRLYLDSSALVKLIQTEEESAALGRYLRQSTSAGDSLVTSALARVEVVRAVAPGGAVAIDHARRLLNRLDQVQLTNQVLDRAAQLEPGRLLRSLDAIHLAAALVIGADLRAVVTYDQRMAEAAADLALVVQAPGGP